MLYSALIKKFLLWNLEVISVQQILPDTLIGTGDKDMKKIQGILWARFQFDRWHAHGRICKSTWGWGEWVLCFNLEHENNRRQVRRRGMRLMSETVLSQHRGPSRLCQGVWIFFIQTQRPRWNREINLRQFQSSRQCRRKARLTVDQ